MRDASKPLPRGETYRGFVDIVLGWHDVDDADAISVEEDE